MENKGGKINFTFVDKSKTYNAEDLLLVREQSRIYSVKTSEIKLIIGNIQYTEVILIENKTFTMRASLKEWESKLPSELFKRVHKSTIVNCNFVESYISTKGKLFLKIENWKEDIVVSRRKHKLILNKNRISVLPISSNI